MKKIVSIGFVFILVFAPLFAVPSEDEVGMTLEGVMMVYGTIIMGTMFGSEFEGVQVEMDMEKGDYHIICDKMDVTELFSADNPMGAMMTQDGEDIPQLVFTEISGSMLTNEAGDFDMNVTLKGGPVKTLILNIVEEDVITFKADGKSFKYLTENPDFKLMED